MYLLTTLLISLYLYSLLQHLFTSKKFPKNYKPLGQSYALRKSFIPCHRNRFSKKKIPDDIDTIVIGSGIGGLTTGALLAKVGQKVLVLEQHDVAGGTTHMFNEHGVEHETGVHYIGNVKERTMIFDEIMTEPIEWDKMGENNDGIYDEIYIEDRCYKFRAGEENFMADLIEKFPEEENGIRKYIKYVKKVANKDLFFDLKILRPIWLQNILVKLLCGDFYDIVGKNTYDVVKSFTQNEELIAVLTGQFGDYGTTPKESSFYMHASVVNHYLEGGYYPRGGPVEIAKRIIPTIEKSGGCVLVGKKVDKILIDESNTAYGVKMENEVEIRAKNIVSAAGIRTTYKTLLDQKYEKMHGIDKLLDNVKPSPSFVYLFVNLEGKNEDYDLRDSNLWIWPNRDYDNMVKEYMKDPLNPSVPMPMFIASGSAKDSKWKENCPNKCSVIILTFADWNMFDQKTENIHWKDQKINKRSLEYKQMKEQFAHRMLNEGLYKYYPKTKGHVLRYDVSTPLTTAYYLNTVYGECYGLDSSVERYRDYAKILRPMTPINNFFLSGQDVCTLGITGSMIGGVMTAHSVLGYGTLFDMINGRNLFDDLQYTKKQKIE